ncbi:MULTISPECIES: hypothetical protein [Nocardia]|uniref:Uncharacterized protein n=2 Tax=Nocardia TaxID=1817 RepID=A0A2T2ZCT7_9NOCA|nr:MULTISPECIES: hypothetical protein [Nocardia]MBF6245452.1 hypothetical protein [Nocardia elegans]MBF6447490.1 hypothetical protein [Nocardia elegans]PSR65550.1 hypothetical protein C8259_05435 [Nocardia nova]
MGTWNALSSVVTVLAGCGVVLLAVGCFWPSDDPPRTGRVERWNGANTGPPITRLTDWSCAPPARSFTTAEAHHWMQIHRDHDCPRKREAFAALVAAGRIRPDSTRPNTLRSDDDE